MHTCVWSWRCLGVTTLNAIKIQQPCLARAPDDEKKEWQEGWGRTRDPRVIRRRGLLLRRRLALKKNKAKWFKKNLSKELREKKLRLEIAQDRLRDRIREHGEAQVVLGRELHLRTLEYTALLELLQIVRSL